MWRFAVSLFTICALPHSLLAQTVGISGTVRYYSSDAPVPDVTMQLLGTGGTTTTTNPSGGYAFTQPSAAGFLLEPAKTGGQNGAVTALDAALILQAAVGLKQLTPYQEIACDVTGDGTVGPLDAARILQLIVGLRTRLPIADECGSDWAFVPNPAASASSQLMMPQMSPMCSPGGILYGGLTSSVAAQDFVAIAFGDCTGNWQTLGVPPPTATPLPTNTATSTAQPTNTVVPSATAVPATVTITATPSRTASATRTPTFTITPTRTVTDTPTRTPSSTGTPTRTGTRTTTPTLTFTTTPTPTAMCANGLAWNVTAPLSVSVQSGGRIWLAKSIPTDFGWGLFWLREDPGVSSQARLYYAHVDFNGQITVPPKMVIGITKIVFRDHYYMAAWNTDHFGLLIADQASLIYYNMALDGTLSARKVTSVPLFTSTIYDQEAEGDVDAFPGGFLGVVDGECVGHSCSYAFKLDVNGNPLSSPINLVDFDSTHQFYPTAAFDGAGFAILTVKDIQITGGGVMTKYLQLSGGISSNAKVVPAKEYLWDEFPDIAWNGDHFAALWTENSARSDTAPWQIHFASFRRTKSASTLIADRVVDMVAKKTDQRWTTQVHAVGGEWVAQYATRAADNTVSAVYELLGDDAKTHAAIEPFTQNADALGSSPHFAAGHVGELGIARGAFVGAGTELTFQKLPPPACN